MLFLSFLCYISLETFLQLFVFLGKAYVCPLKETTSSIIATEKVRSSRVELRPAHFKGFLTVTFTHGFTVQFSLHRMDLFDKGFHVRLKITFVREQSTGRHGIFNVPIHVGLCMEFSQVASKKETNSQIVFFHPLR